MSKLTVLTGVCIRILFQTLFYFSMYFLTCNLTEFTFTSVLSFALCLPSSHIIQSLSLILKFPYEQSNKQKQT